MSAAVKDEPAENPSFNNPHDYDHRHSNVSGGWLRASVFGAMDGLVSNVGLIAGIGAAGATPGIVILTGVSGLISGAISMALGEYTSVKTQNEQLESEVTVERSAFQRNPQGEQAELARMFTEMGMQEETASRAAAEVHHNDEVALRLHVSQELGVDPHEKPSPFVAAWASFIFFSLGAVIPLIPYFFGSTSLIGGLISGGVGLIIIGAVSARFSKGSWWRSSLRQLLFGSIAIVSTYAIGRLIGVDALG